MSYGGLANYTGREIKFYVLQSFQKVENLKHRLRKTRLRWFGPIKGRRPVGRPKKTWSKVVEEDMRKLNITEDTAEDRKQWRQLISCLTPGVGN